MTVAVSAQEVTRTYGRPGTAGAVTAVAGITVDFSCGQLHAIVGASGSGKSTLLHLLATLDRPTTGTVRIGAQDVTRLHGSALAKTRQRIGFVFQRFNLVPSLSAQRNIRLPLDLAGNKIDEIWYWDLVDRLGLEPLLRRHPSEMSGGQQQRVAIARALLGKPSVVFADEPTGSLDTENAGEVLALLGGMSKETGTTLILVTHDESIAGVADRVIRIVDGSIASDTSAPLLATASSQAAPPGRQQQQQ